MVRLNGVPISPSGEISPEIVKTFAQANIFNPFNNIDFRLDDNCDLTLLCKVCRNTDRVWNSAGICVNMPYFPYSYGKITPTFRRIVKTINDLVVEEVKVIDASDNLSSIHLKRMKNEKIAVRRAMIQMRDELSLMGETWITPKNEIRAPYGKLSEMYEMAQQAGIYILLASNFDRYNEALKYNNVFADIGDGADDCTKVIVIDDFLEDIEKYEMISEQLRTNNPNLKFIIVCAPHCTNDIYGSKLINQRKINRIITTNSYLQYKPDSMLTEQEQYAITILDAFKHFEDLSASPSKPPHRPTTR